MDDDALQQLYADSTDVEIMDALRDGEAAFKPEAWRAISREAAKRGITFATVAASDAAEAAIVEAERAASAASAAAAAAVRADEDRAQAVASPVVVVEFEDDERPIYPTWCLGCGAVHAGIALKFWRWGGYHSAFPRRFVIPMCEACSRVFRVNAGTDRLTVVGTMVVGGSTYYLSSVEFGRVWTTTGSGMVAVAAALAWLMAIGYLRRGTATFTVSRARYKLIFRWSNHELAGAFAALNGKTVRAAV
jgi:hypothetical protein